MSKQIVTKRIVRLMIRMKQVMHTNASLTGSFLEFVISRVAFSHDLLPYSSYVGITGDNVNFFLTLNKLFRFEI